MYENGKMRTVETILRMGVKENDGGGVSTFVNVTMYPQYNNNMIIKKKNLQWLPITLD
jgi:hypothetical protein